MLSNQLNKIAKKSYGWVFLQSNAQKIIIRIILHRDMIMDQCFISSKFYENY